MEWGEKTALLIATNMRQFTIDKKKIENKAQVPVVHHWVYWGSYMSLPLKVIPGSQGQHHHPNVSALGPTDSKPGICDKETNEPPAATFFLPLFLPIDPLSIKAQWMPLPPLKGTPFPLSQAHSSFPHDAETLEGDQKGWQRRFQLWPSWYSPRSPPHPAGTEPTIP